MIEEWLANKTIQIVAGVLALLGVVCTPVAIVQTVRLDGVSLFGWHLVDGALSARDAANAARDQAVHDRDVWKGNADRLGSGLDRCNASVDSLAAAGQRMQAAAQALVDQRLKEAKQFADRISAVGNVKSTGENCPVVDQIFSTGFGQ